MTFAVIKPITKFRTIIETYLCCFEKRLLDIEIASKGYNDLTKEERDASYSLKDDPSIIIKGADKDSRNLYVLETYKQHDDGEVNEEIPNSSNVLINFIMKALEKIRLRVDLLVTLSIIFLLMITKW